MHTHIYIYTHIDIHTYIYIYTHIVKLAQAHPDRKAECHQTADSQNRDALWGRDELNRMSPRHLAQAQRCVKT